MLACAGCNLIPNALPTGQPAIMADGLNPAEVLTANIGDVMDADNVASAGAITGPVFWTWKVDLAGDGVFTTLIRVGTGDDVEATGETLVLLPEDNGLQIKVEARFQDETGVIESVTSAAVLIAGAVGPAPVIPDELAIANVTFTARAQRLEVDGTVSPVTANVTLFTQGTATAGICSGTPVETQANGDGTFDFDIRGVAADPGTICVSADNGLAVNN